MKSASMYTHSPSTTPQAGVSCQRSPATRETGRPIAQSELTEVTSVVINSSPQNTDGGLHTSLAISLCPVELINSSEKFPHSKPLFSPPLIALTLLRVGRDWRDPAMFFVSFFMQIDINNLYLRTLLETVPS